VKKLKLDIQALRVESFEAAVSGGPQIGTVRGNAESYDACSEAKGCSDEDSCAITNCLTCLCPHTGPQPSCDPCSWMDCNSFDVTTCP